MTAKVKGAGGPVDRPKVFVDARGKAFRSCHLMDVGSGHWAVRVGDVSVLFDQKVGADVAWAVLGKIQQTQRKGLGSS